MTTKLTRPARREVVVDGEVYTVMISPDGVRITKKGFRKGHGISWRRLLREGEEQDATADVP